MGLAVRNCCSWLLLLAVVYGPGFGCSGDGALVRHRRQSDWWRNNQRVVPGQSQGSSRGGSGGTYPGTNAVYGFGASRGGAQRVSTGGRAGGMLRQQPPTVISSSSPISVQCEEDRMVVSVMMDFYGNGKLVKSSDLSLGPQGCKPNTQSADEVIFQISLQDCGNTVQMMQDWVIYATNLTYSPTSSIPIIRTNPAVVPIMCYYYRHANVSSKAIEPTWVPFSTTVSIEERLSFSLRLMTEDWSGPRSSPIYQLGDILYIEASVDTQNHVGLILYIDRCVTTISPDPTSAPNYGLIEENGCLVDGMQDDSSSAFITPRVEPDKLQFTVDAFRFLGNDASLIYITCYLRAAATTQVPDAMTKACSYSKATQSWSAVEGPSSICQCCGTGTCSNPTALVSGGRGRFGRPRGKRDVLDEPHTEEGQTVTTLGPLLVIGPSQRDVSAAVTREESAPAELWVLVAVGCLSLLVVIVCAVFIGKSLKKPHYVLSVKK
ncbi:zona pellucida sperm-binding protein 3-like isoform X1 [Rana temporaria]|uniref:zona pellucida sperm-binding protein 3-like isoform X1 n=1 Tax=Rana temporaria TaxID=8407 RepID=UPI001AACCA15|nr:zona pellucida sperm-binding protein 3-like isoform X1 [Rana temporaria]